MIPACIRLKNKIGISRSRPVPLDCFGGAKLDVLYF